jgi:outer membrane protein OmpA-like peptidoglycan-associated protein
VAMAIFLSAGLAAAEPTHARIGHLGEVRFGRGSSELPVLQRERTQRTLGVIAAWAIENPDALVVLDGYGEGSRPRAVRLSLARAQTVKDSLVEAGVDPDQIVIAGYATGARPRVVIWGTRAGVEAVYARTFRRGHVVHPRPAVRTQVTIR